MKKMNKLLVEILLIAMIPLCNIPVIFSQDFGNPPPRPEEGDLYLELSTDYLEILSNEEKSIIINLTAKNGNIPNVSINIKNLKSPNEQNLDFSWIGIVYNDKIFEIGEKIEIDEIKKDETKSIKLNFKPTEGVNLGEYQFKVECSPNPKEYKPKDTFTIIVLEKGKLVINMDKIISKENPLEVGIGTTEEINFNFSYDKEKKLEGLSLKLDSISLPEGIENVNIKWISINDKEYKIGEEIKIDLDKPLNLKFSPPKPPPIDFKGEYEFKISFKLEIGDIVEPSTSEFQIFIKVVEWGTLNISISKEELEVIKGDEESIIIKLSTINGDLKDISFKLIGLQDYNFDWVEIQFENKNYSVGDIIKIGNLLKDEEKEIRVGFKPKEETEEEIYIFKLIIECKNLQDEKEIKINVLKPKVGNLEYTIDSKEKEILFKEDKVGYKLTLTSKDGEAGNISFNLSTDSKFKFNYQFIPDKIEKLKEDEEVEVNIIIEIPKELKDSVEKNKSYLDEYKFNVTISFNENQSKEFSVYFKFKFKIIELKIGKKIMFVNNEPKEIDVAPVIKEGRTLLPIRWVAEPLGADVGWDGTERKVTVSLGDVFIELWIGKSIARVNGVEKPIDPNNPKVVPMIIKGRTMLPVRFVAENLGADVLWDGTTRTVTIIYPGGD